MKKYAKFLPTHNIYILNFNHEHTHSFTSGHQTGWICSFDNLNTNLKKITRLYFYTRSPTLQYCFLHFLITNLPYIFMVAAKDEPFRKSPSFIVSLHYTDEWTDRQPDTWTNGKMHRPCLKQSTTFLLFIHSI